jgi:helicase SWR1
MNLAEAFTSRAHRIGQIRDVHIYRFVSQYTVEEAMLRKANQKRSLDDLVIQKGEFDWRTLFSDESTSALTKALGEYEDAEDHLAAIVAAREETSLVGADDDDFDEDGGTVGGSADRGVEPGTAHDNEIEEEQGGTVVDYMIVFVEQDWDHFSDWRV